MLQEKSALVLRLLKQKHLFPNQPSRLAAFFTMVIRFGVSLHRDFVQSNVLDSGPDDRQATGLRGEHIDLIGALPHVAEHTLNGIGRLNMSAHGSRKLVKRQQVLFVLSQASYRFWIALSVPGFKRRQLG